MFYVRSSDFGVTFSDPIRVNGQPGSAIATGTIRGGQLALGIPIPIAAPGEGGP